MEAKAKSEFLKRIVTNGFSVEDHGDTLILRPRGAVIAAEVIIKEVEPNDWQVGGASGEYAGFYRGRKRQYFESYIKVWVAQSLAVAAV